MKIKSGLALLFSCFLLACQPSPASTVTILDNDRVILLPSKERLPSVLLSEAGLSLGPNDRILVNGLLIDINQAITNDPVTLQVRRAMGITLNTPQGQQAIKSSAFTLGAALAEASLWLREGDKISQSIASPISGVTSPLSIKLSIPLTVTTYSQTRQVDSSAETVGEALAEARLALVGLDYSIPAEKEPLPSDGQIKVVHVSESVVLAQKPIPFDSDIQGSAQVPLDQTQILQPGEPGLSVQRIRIRYEDGKEISRLTENETLVRPPKTRVLGYGTKVEIKTATVDGVQIEYWRAVQMYATSYAPCRSGTEECHSGTSSGKSLRKGMVGLRYSWYLAMGGQQLYIPGYGYATVEDVCGGCTGQPWIDLGFSDSDYETWHSWVTVYFLTPVPPNIIYVLE
jgi:resuscitation-promoting factor RpfB